MRMLMTGICHCFQRSFFFFNQFFYVSKTPILEAIHWARRAQAEMDGPSSSLALKVAVRDRVTVYYCCQYFEKKKFYGSGNEFAWFLTYSVLQIHTFIDLTFTDDICAKPLERRKALPHSLGMDCCWTQACTYMCTHTNVHSLMQIHTVRVCTNAWKK